MSSSSSQSCQTVSIEDGKGSTTHDSNKGCTPSTISVRGTLALRGLASLLFLTAVPVEVPTVTNSRLPHFRNLFACPLTSSSSLVDDAEFAGQGIASIPRSVACWEKATVPDLALVLLGWLLFPVCNAALSTSRADAALGSSSSTCLGSSSSENSMTGATSAFDRPSFNSFSINSISSATTSLIEGQSFEFVSISDPDPFDAALLALDCAATIAGPTQLMSSCRRRATPRRLGGGAHNLTWAPSDKSSNLGNRALDAAAFFKASCACNHPKASSAAFLMSSHRVREVVQGIGFSRPNAWG